MAQEGTGLGKWAFLIGLVLAVLFAFLTFQYAGALLLVLGLVVGFLNISGKEEHDYLVASIAILVASAGVSGALASFGSLNLAWLSEILSHFSVFVGASAFVVAVKRVLSLGAA